ncbi:zinc finger protein 90 homolog isoform X2 [Electrophorus electricus]|uniref:zinc finger protein 90 homolog isoform X2 n=1 Tax=Electrophorus electricus TaxID=8005 RepID=UPI0015D00932|nr:zinc finger protein 90 homolog isoform X2 [Electrophorus electricus]
MVDSHFQVQLTAVLEVLMKSAVADICALTDNWFRSLQMEIIRSKKENEELRQKLYIMEQFPPEPELENEITKGGKAGTGSEMTNSAEAKRMARNSAAESATPRRGHSKLGLILGVKAEMMDRSANERVEQSLDESSDVVYAPVCIEPEIRCPLYDISPDLKTEPEKVQHDLQNSVVACGTDVHGYCEDETEETVLLTGECETESSQHFPQPKREEEEFDISCLLTSDLQHNSTHLLRDTNAEMINSDYRMSLNLARDFNFMVTSPNAKHLNFLERTSISLTCEKQKGKKYTCNVCGKKLSTKYSFAAHYRLHTKEKPFTCAQCGKRFAKKFNLDIHYNVHTGAKPYACTLCPKMFADPSAFGRHKRTH